jgi:hypothetical protein
MKPVFAGLVVKGELNHCEKWRSCAPAGAKRKVAHTKSASIFIFTVPALIWLPMAPGQESSNRNFCFLHLISKSLTK